MVNIRAVIVQKVLTKVENHYVETVYINIYSVLFVMGFEHILVTTPDLHNTTIRWEEFSLVSNVI